MRMVFMWWTVTIKGMIILLVMYHSCLHLYSHSFQVEIDQEIDQNCCDWNWIQNNTSYNPIVHAKNGISCRSISINLHTIMMGVYYFNCYIIYRKVDFPARQAHMHCFLSVHPSACDYRRNKSTGQQFISRKVLHLVSPNSVRT